MNNKLLTSLIIINLISLLSLGNSFAKPSDKTLSGGDTKRNPVIGLNFFWGKFKGAAEIEGDIRIHKIISIAPRIGLDQSNYFTPGVSLRFGIIKGKRPHGFWVGPALDFIFYRTTDVFGNKTTHLNPTLTAEFGYRYTFKFGLSLLAMARGGWFFNAGGGFYWITGPGVGYAF